MKDFLKLNTQGHTCTSTRLKRSQSSSLFKYRHNSTVVKFWTMYVVHCLCTHSASQKII